MSRPLRIALKVDCDTAEGTKHGIPRLLRLFDELGIRATFFFSLGPDRSGRAILRVFTRKGFLAKMLRSRAPSLYPWRTMLSGTLLPAPVIGNVARAPILSVRMAGHEIGVHAWDHVGWHDGLSRWAPERVRSEYAKLHESFRDIFGEPARASACPGWTVSEAYLSERERYPLLYTSDTRGGGPFLPRASGFVSRIPEIPSTLATLDELLGDPRIGASGDLAAVFGPLSGDVVHTIHTEVEGGPYLAAFGRLLREWRGTGAEFVPLETFAAEARERSGGLPTREIATVTLAGRAGTVASQR
jgi:peptidoglycan/xylan/chitin deacetylase (PgdA/CDA1 family)